MRKYSFFLLAVFLLASCGFAPDKAEVQRRIVEALPIDMPNEFKIVKTYGARAVDDVLESFIIEFTQEGYESFNKQINLDKWEKEDTGYKYSKQLDERRNVTISINPNNRQLHYKHLHH